MKIGKEELHWPKPLTSDSFVLKIADRRSQIEYRAILRRAKSKERTCGQFWLRVGDIYKLKLESRL